MNKIILIGRIANDLELNKTTSDKSVMNFNLAVKRDSDTTDFIKCKVFGKNADNLKQYQGKGSLIAVIGSYHVDSYTKDGENKTFHYVLVNEVKFLEKKKTKTPYDFVQPQMNIEKLSNNDPFADFGEEISIEDNFLE